MTINEKILKIVRYALENDDGPKLLALSDLFEKRGRMANSLSEILTDNHSLTL